MMGHKFALKAAREFLIAAGGRPAPLSLSEEELNPMAQDDHSLQAQALEPVDCSYPVAYSFPNDSSTTEFLFFEDGRQRTIQIGVIPTRLGNNEILIPVHYFVVAAVILQRDGRRLVVWDAPIMRQGILVQRSLVPQHRVFEEFESQGLSVLDTEAEGGDYYQLRSRALQSAKDLRLGIENELISHWRSRTTEDFLVVDGTLMNFRNEDNIQRCVGVSRSFGSRYFSVADHTRILKMPEFHRSWLFKFHGEDEDLRKGVRERISWYLRIRQGTRAEPEFGLLRIELSLRHLKQASVLANRLSKSLISERLPTPYPLAGWDKRLYPIRECGNYLDSLMPSTTTIRASMGA
jgi:hypothetical protein